MILRLATLAQGRPFDKAQGEPFDKAQGEPFDKAQGEQLTIDNQQSTINVLPMLKSILAKIGLALIVIALIDLVYINYWVLQSSKREAESSQAQKEQRKTESLPSPALTESTKPASSSIDETIVATPSPTTIVTTQVQQQTVVQTAQKEIFIPIGSGSTFKNSYTDLPGVEVTIDERKYSGIESVVFEASIWVQDGNGKIYAQLYNKTDGRPVWNSEISTSSASGVLTTSPKIALESGSRTYKVQAKTNLTEYAAHVDNARVKITLK